MLAKCEQNEPPKKSENKIMSLQPSRLIEALVAHALGEDDPPMTDTRIKVALELLKISENRRREANARKAERANAKKKAGMTHEEALRLLDE